MRFAFFRYYIFFALICGAATTRGQMNPHTQIRWPTGCSSTGNTYDYATNTCIPVVRGPNVNPQSQITWPVACSQPGYVYSFQSNDCVSAAGIAANPAGPVGAVQQNNSGVMGSYTANGLLGWVAPGTSVDGSNNWSFPLGIKSPLLTSFGLPSNSFWGGGTANINSFFNNTTYCNGSSKPCVAIIDPGYNNADNPYTWNGSKQVMGASQAALFDYRNGQVMEMVHNPAASNYNSAGLNSAHLRVLFNDLTQNHPVGSGAITLNVNGLSQYIWQMAPGLSLGNPGHGPTGWDSHKAIVSVMQVATPGISVGHTCLMWKTGVGDNFCLESQTFTYGGATAPADESNHAARFLNGTSPTQYLGTVATGGGGIGATTVTVNCTQDCGNLASGQLGGPGDGRYLVLSTPIISGNATAQTNPSGNAPGTFTIDTPVAAASTAWGTLNGNCDPPISAPVGIAGTQTTCNVTMISGTFAATDHVCFGGNFHEQAVLTPTGTSSTSIGGLFRHQHNSGSWVMANGPCGTFFDPVANHTSASGTALIFPYDIIGATNTTTLVYSWFQYGTQNNGITAGEFLIQQLAATGLTNVGGIVTFAISGVTVLTNPQFYNGQTVTFTGASVSAYNGQCTNTFLVAGSTNILGCTQSSSNGAAANATATAAWGTTGYGNSAFNLLAGAETLSVLTCTSSPCTVSPGNATTFTLEPNSVNWANSAGVVQPQHYAVRTNQMGGQQQMYNPSGNKDSSGWSLILTGPGACCGQSNSFTTFPAVGINNYQSATGFYSYFGGLVNPPGGIQFKGNGGQSGLFNYYVAAQIAPAPVNADAYYIGCPLTGCTDIGYYYRWFHMAGRLSDFTMQYFPYGTEMLAGGNWAFSNPLAKTTFNDNVAGAAIATPAAPTVTPSTSGGNLTASFTRCFTVVAVNSVGTTPQSTETCQTTGSGSTNSFTLKWARTQGAQRYQVCGGSSGAELFMFQSNPSTTDDPSWTDNGSITPSGSCSTTNTTQPALDQWSYTGLSSSGTAFEMKMQAPAGVAATYTELGPETGTAGQLVDIANSTTTVAGHMATFSNTTGRIQDGGAPPTKYTQSWTPTAVTASTCAEQTVTVTGVGSTQAILAANPPSALSHVWIGSKRASAANTVAVEFCADATGGTPPSGNWLIVAY